ncbi:DUF6000 family protein [Yinghuangia soli]|uniref:DUF6000 family protein n=1 Tax=Yinghuangia soli TaxID=2908204 RepID=A0AA41Q3J8_9ACTN|nr:DUF6000 family protein [Yinghuangia soli]MCF2530903.1 DUF6000 family protein [Yinghuangia soli]
MRFANDDDPELRDLVVRFVRPGRRYMQLAGGMLQLSGPERDLFVGELVQAAREITPAELGVLFEGGWRERRTAAWLVAVSGRTDFRGRIGELMLGAGNPQIGAYCITLATFRTSADADLVCAYLDRHSSQPELIYDRTFALGTLLHLDAVLGADRASSYGSPDGLRHHRYEGHSDAVRRPREAQELVAQFCAFANECGELYAR